MTKVNLEKLLESGGFINVAYREQDVTWKNREGEELEFTVRIKEEMTAADLEFIVGMGDKRADKSEASAMARRVARMVQVYDPETKDWQHIPVGAAERMDLTLLSALSLAIGGNTTPPESEDEAAKN